MTICTVIYSSFDKHGLCTEVTPFVNLIPAYHKFRDYLIEIGEDPENYFDPQKRSGSMCAVVEDGFGEYFRVEMTFPEIQD